MKRTDSRRSLLGLTLFRVARGQRIPAERQLLVIRCMRDGKALVRIRMLIEDRWVCPTVPSISEHFHIYQMYADIEQHLEQSIEYGIEHRQRAALGWRKYFSKDCLL